MIVLMRIESTRRAPIPARRNHRRGIALRNAFDQRLGIVGFVRNDGLRDHAIKYRLSLPHIVHLATAQAPARRRARPSTSA